MGDFSEPPKPHFTQANPVSKRKVKILATIFILLGLLFIGFIAVGVKSYLEAEQIIREMSSYDDGGK